MRSCLPSDKERDVENVLTFGESFNVIETLHQIPLLVDVKSLTAVQLICLNYNDLFGVLKRHPLMYDDFLKSIQKHYVANKSLLDKHSRRLPPMIPTQKALGPGEMFTYTFFDKMEANKTKKAFFMPFKKMGKFSFLMYLLCMNSVNPKKAFFISIETFHYACGLARTITAILYDNIFFPHKRTVNWFFRATDVLYVLILYIRMHVQYHNKIGILVTHPWMTTKRYISTNFFIDLWSFVPISYSGFYDLIGRQNRIMTGYIIRITSRPLQMHRFIGLLNYLQSNIQSSYLYTFQAIKFLTITAVIIGLVGTLFQYHSIKVTNKGVCYTKTV